MYEPNHDPSSPHPADDITSSNIHHNAHPQTDGANGDYITSNGNPEPVVSKPIPAGLK